MNGTDTMNSSLHWSTHRIIRTALSSTSSRVSSDRYMPAPCTLAALTPHCLFGMTFESKVSVRVPKNSFCGVGICEVPTVRVPRVLSTGKFSTFRSFDIKTTHNVEKNYGSMHLSDGIISTKEKTVWV